MKIGDKVVCVDDSPCRCCGEKYPVVKGDVYVIRDMFMGRNDKQMQAGILFLKLLGVVNPSNVNHGIDAGITSDSFRMLDHLKEQAYQQQSKQQTP